MALLASLLANKVKLKGLPVGNSKSVKVLLHSALAKWEPPRGHATIHASDLTRPEIDYCPRQYALMEATGIKAKKVFVGTSMALTYINGKAVESVLRNEILLPYAVGYWQCTHCSSRLEIDGVPFFGKLPNQHHCQCGRSQWKYVEVRFKDQSSGASGSVDVILDIGEAKHVLVEFKTLAAEAFKDLIAPMAEHRLRTAMYLQLAALSGLPFVSRLNLNKGIVVYVSRGFGVRDTEAKESGVKDAGFSPFKEYQVVRSDPEVAKYLNRARALTRYRANPSAGMPCGICPNSFLKRAQICPAVAPCFSGKFPSTLTWMENGEPRHPGKTIVE